MKTTADEHRYFYVDETGDPSFYGKGKKLIVGNEGCSLTFGVGFLRTTDPTPIRERLLDVRKEISTSKYLSSVPSIQKTLKAFHAKDDCPEVRKLVYEALHDQDFAVQVIVARKHEKIFTGKHQGSQDAFYDDLISKLFQTQLHIASKNSIIFARRGDKAKQHALRSAVETGVSAFRRKYPRATATIVNVETAYSADDVLLQAADYALWAVQRAFERSEMRYFEYLRHRFTMVWDVYDFQGINARRQVIYSRRYPFHIDKVSPLS